VNLTPISALPAMRHLILISILASGFALPAVSRAASVRTLAFDLPATEVSFDLADAAATSNNKTGDKNKLRLDARMNRFSTPVNLPPGRYLATSKDFKSADPFTLPDTAGARYLLLILPKPDGGCAIFPIPDDVSKIGPGDRFLLNGTREEIAVRFGTQRATLKPGHSEYLRPPRPAPADQRIEVEMARRVGTAWIPFNSTYWPLDPRARSFVLLYPDPVTGTPRVRNLSEVP
jgi:hypothetical protein